MLDIAANAIEQQQSYDHLIRNKIIKEYLPYVKRIVNRIATHLPPTIETDDLVNVGVIGLIQAIDRFDPSRDNKFTTYAVFRIKGAVLTELRSRDFLGRIIRRRVREMEKAFLKLESLGREPTDEDMAAEMGLELKKYRKIKAASAISFVSFEELGYKDRREKVFMPNSQLGDENEYVWARMEMKMMKNALAKHIDALPEKEKIVISLYYAQEMTMKEIGRVLDVTESRVSQIHAQALIRLRIKLRKDKYLDD